MSECLVGLEVFFIRNNQKVKGKIIKVLDRSAILEISQEDADKIESPSTLTVVNHNHYEMITDS
ncbi:hypothetical protein WQ54_28925 [Bacillus sp. SA1-12]|uniref:DUF2187 family protein n=1 Tax=Bacillus sp. SA1-12 TaxID=1455638 RepID=UPI000627469C|nr:DUF2187 family protein [Bacillus sp. SA1-12]KKI88941.1 hypothetical protein WQ54_28925 [Bacillus sp. SA1-12]